MLAPFGNQPGRKHVTRLIIAARLTLGWMFLCGLTWSSAKAQTDATWTGGVSVNFDVDGVSDVTDLTLGVGSTLTIAPGEQLNVLDDARISGTITTTAGTFTASGAGAQFLNNSALLRVSGAGRIAIAAAAYSNFKNDYRANLTFLSAQGQDSLLDLSSAQSFDALGTWGHNGNWLYDVVASDHGVIDLSSLGTINGAGQDDWLRFRIETEGNIPLTALTQTSGRTLFSVDVDNYSFPALETAANTHFAVGAGRAVVAPELITMPGSGSGVGVSDGGSFTAAKLTTISGSGGSLSVGDQATLDAPELLSIDRREYLRVGPLGGRSRGGRRRRSADPDPAQVRRWFRANPAVHHQRPNLWDLDDADPHVEILAEQLGMEFGWQDETLYNFQIDYKSDGTIDLLVRQALDGQIIWNVGYVDSSPLGPGKIGFYNFGQASVRYTNLDYASSLPDGHYQLTAHSGNPGLRDLEGNFLDGDETTDVTQFASEPGTYLFTAFYAADGTYSATVDVFSASGEPNPARAAIEVTIDSEVPQLLDGASVAEAPWSVYDFTFSDPEGTPIEPVTVSGGGDTYELGFAYQTAAGNYTLRIGPDIADVAGNWMETARDDLVPLLPDVVAPRAIRR